MISYVFADEDEPDRYISCWPNLHKATFDGSVGGESWEVFSSAINSPMSSKSCFSLRETSFLNLYLVNFVTRGFTSSAKSR